MYCEKCGAPIDDGSVFCQKCGEKQMKATDINSNKDVLDKKHPKKAKIIIPAVILCLVAAIVAVSVPFLVNGGLPEASASDFEYEYDEDLGGVVITKYLRIAPKVRIPQKIEGKPVVGIDGAFSGTEVTEVYIPNSVTAIRGYAFNRCKNLTSITIPDSVTTLDSFVDCTSLTSITLPEGLETLGNMLFSGCTKLTSVTLPDSLTTIDSQVFLNCRSLTSITIPNGVTYIDLTAFDGTGITSIELPDNVQHVRTRGTGPFQDFTVIYKGKKYTNDLVIEDGKLYTSKDAYYRSIATNGVDADVNLPTNQPATGESFTGADSNHSNNHDTRTVPNLTGLTLESAKQRIIDRDLVYGGYTEEESFAPKGTVLRQFPEVFTEVDSGTTVTVVISAGEQPVDSSTAQSSTNSTSEQSGTGSTEEFVPLAPEVLSITPRINADDNASILLDITISDLSLGERNPSHYNAGENLTITVNGTKVNHQTTWRGGKLWLIQINDINLSETKTFTVVLTNQYGLSSTHTVTF